MCNLKTAKLQKQKFHLLKKCNHRSTIYPPQLYLAGASIEALCVCLCNKTPRYSRCFIAIIRFLFGLFAVFGAPLRDFAVMTAEEHARHFHPLPFFWASVLREL